MEGGKKENSFKMSFSKEIPKALPCGLFLRERSNIDGKKEIIIDLETTYGQNWKNQVYYYTGIAFKVMVSPSYNFNDDDVLSLLIVLSNIALEETSIPEEVLQENSDPWRLLRLWAIEKYKKKSPELYMGELYKAIAEGLEKQNISTIVLDAPTFETPNWNSSSSENGCQWQLFLEQLRAKNISIKCAHYNESSKSYLSKLTRSIMLLGD
jgi:hypothetical protein